MNTKYLAAALCISFALIGCDGGWNQNPLDGKKGNFGTGLPVPSKPDLAKPLPSDAVRISIPDFQAFQEGASAEFSITSRVLLEGYTSEVSIENLAEFPGATYNPATGIFKWAPPVGFVSNNGSLESFLVKTLVVRAYGFKPNGQTLAADAQRLFYIFRSFSVPTILNVVKPSSYVREGSSMILTATVFDKDAVVTDQSTWPRINILPINGEKSIAGLTSLTGISSIGNNQYKISLKVDLQYAELTNSISTYSLALSATSRFGKQSLVQNINVDVYTELSSPVSTWTEPLVLTETEPTTYKFIVSDPKAEARMSLDRTTSLPSGADLSCQPLARGVLDCTFTWTPSEGQARTYDFSATFSMRNFDPRDTWTPLKPLSFRTQVLAKGS